MTTALSTGWSWYVIIGTIVSLIACFWLIWYAKNAKASDEELAEAESHVWDEDIRELNNPLPRWWLWLFVITIIWSGLYLIYYPGLGNFAGVGSWSQEGQYEAEIEAANERFGPLFAKFGAMDIDTLVNDEDALSVGASLFANYCSQCHGSTAQGARGFPDLTDSEWLHGSDPASIEQTILQGRNSVMPSLGAVFPNEESIEAMIDYVLTMQDGQDTSSPAHAQYMSLCIACHGPSGEGLTALGGPALNNDIWLYGSSRDAIRTSIVDGRNGVMPAHSRLIGPDRARILAAYVTSLSQ